MDDKLAAGAGPTAALQVEDSHHAIVAVHIPDLHIILCFVTLDTNVSATVGAQGYYACRLA